MVKKAKSRKSRSSSNSNSNSNSNSLISQDYFSSQIDININEVFPVVVMATMSSGKSTLINALLGEQLLPSRNVACTAKVYSVLDDDRETETSIYITDSSGKTIEKRKNIIEELEKANSDNNISHILIRGHVRGVLNTDKALLLIDTPGTNNSRDDSHEKITMDILKKIKGGVLLYVLNATQFAINDDKALLDRAVEFAKKNKKVSLLFVLNKVDQIDEEKEESVEKSVLSVQDYLISSGIKEPQIIPISALAASLFKKVINGESLTRSEYRSFIDYYEIYKPKDFNMRSFACTKELKEQHKEIEVRGEKYTIGDLNRAIENCGMKLLEEEIQKAQILSSGAINNKIRIRK